MSFLLIKLDTCNNFTDPATIANLFPCVEEACTLAVYCQRADFSASRICRAVEDCDVHVLNLNVTAEVAPGNQSVVSLRIGARNPYPVIRSLERFGYDAIPITVPADADEDAQMENARNRANELLHYLNI